MNLSFSKLLINKYFENEIFENFVLLAHVKQFVTNINFQFIISNSKKNERLYYL